jgi:hypothetical protein
MSESDPRADPPERAQARRDEPAKNPSGNKPDDSGPGKADVIALGVGCLIVIIFFVAIGLVGLTRE